MGVNCTAIEAFQFYFSFPVPLGSIPELPADSCEDIKASEGGQVVSGPYWLDPARSGDPSLVFCDMERESKLHDIFHLIRLKCQTKFTHLIFNFLLLAVDYCFRHQCKNDATCVSSHVNYTCACNSSGWTGYYCELRR